ncbi:MAG: type II toxin-antitoxin system VapC family toxin [Planctomycetes bacterium]|nr:type II toxin-antitoxin system VapC family toxin [Planctomycetota bacterium]
MLLDTSGLLAVLDPREPLHALACSQFDAANLRLTHNYILAEFVPLAHSRSVARTDALTFMVDFLDSPDAEVVWVDEQLHRDALALLFARLDKTYSLCDAVSFILMRRYALTDALTTDRHFEQEGFRRLLVNP